jgi:hypothetical protein
MRLLRVDDDLQSAISDRPHQRMVAERKRLFDISLRVQRLWYANNENAGVR